MRETKWVRRAVGRVKWKSEVWKALLVVVVIEISMIEVKIANFTY